MKVVLSFLFVLFSVAFGYSQTVVSGVITDELSGETIPGAAVIYSDGKGVATDLDGKYSFSVPPGEYTIKVMYAGMKEIERKVVVGNSKIQLDFGLSSVEMKEVEVIGDVAVGRKTPVAYSDISSIKIKEELGTRDIPLLLNSTPGIYATQGGGGDGDSRINIRGFNQKYVAVMVDGIPMNDMENGSVFWSNWFGLDVITQKMQVQRGLGASKLAIPSIGGTINILTEGIDQKARGSVRTELGNNQNLRETFSYNSGRLKGGWGITSALSVSKNNGWVENLRSKRLYYFLKVQKEWLNHSLSYTIMGSPQEHFQRPNRESIYFYDTDYGVNKANASDKAPMGYKYPSGNYGVNHNGHWGVLRRTRGNPEAEEEIITARKNYYHKPIMNLKHFWNLGEKLVLSNIVYASFGKGGGTNLEGTTLYTPDGQIDFNQLYYQNTHGSLFDSHPSDLSFVNDTSQYKSSSFLASRINNHFWVGALSTFKYKLNKRFELSGGFDGRYYHTDRYAEVYDLLGGDYTVIGNTMIDYNDPTNRVRRVGDTFEYKIRTYVKQGGVFLLGEYSQDKWTAFLNVTGSINAYNRTNYYLKKTADSTFVTSGWKTIPGGTIKGGANYQINRNHSVFVNAGYLSRAQMVNTFFVGSSLQEFVGVKNEVIIAQEIGYNYKNEAFSGFINFYNTVWKNKPVTQRVDYGTESMQVNVPGMNALHQGMEVELTYKYNTKLSIEGILSIGDWRWTSNGDAIVMNEFGTEIVDTLKFSSKGVKVGDAAQFQTSIGLRYEPIKGLYIRPRITYFDNYYADFDPESLKDANANRQSWKIPAYYQLDISLGYSHALGQDKYRLGTTVNLMNVTNVVFISDAKNNEYYNVNDPNVGTGFNSTSAGVFMGMGFRWNVAVYFNF